MILKVPANQYEQYLEGHAVNIPNQLIVYIIFGKISYFGAYIERKYKVLTCITIEW